MNIEIKKTVNSYNLGKEYFRNLYASGQLPICSKGFLTGGCSSGHKYAKNILCGKEYCEECGKDGSPIHCTRFMRWQSMESKFTNIGYFVITTPKEIREKFKSKLRLNAFRSALKNKLKRLGFQAGLMRWHLFGSCKLCKDNLKGCKNCNYTGAGNEFNPHLNVLIEGSFIKNLEENQTYKDIKCFVLDYYKKKFTYLGADIIINYSYATNIEHRINFIKYITRSTFRIYDHDLAKTFFNFRASSFFGNFSAEKIISQTKSNEHKLEKNICIECNKQINWNKLNPESQIKNPLKHIENGKFKIEPPTNERNRFSSLSRNREKQFRKKIQNIAWRTNVDQTLHI